MTYIKEGKVHPNWLTPNGHFPRREPEAIRAAPSGNRMDSAVRWGWCFTSCRSARPGATSRPPCNPGRHRHGGGRNYGPQQVQPRHCISNPHQGLQYQGLQHPQHQAPGCSGFGHQVHFGRAADRHLLRRVATPGFREGDESHLQQSAYRLRLAPGSGHHGEAGPAASGHRSRSSVCLVTSALLRLSILTATCTMEVRECAFPPADSPHRRGHGPGNEVSGPPTA